MNTYKHRFSARLSSKQLDHVKAQSQPSDFIRELIERDRLVANHEKA